MTDLAPAPPPPPEDPEQETRALWIIAAIVVAVPLAVIAILSWQLRWDWLPNLWFNYAWSSDKGNGPEAIQQTILYGAVALVLIPPLRHALERFAKRHVADLKAHVTEEHRKLHEKVDASHALMHHIILSTPGIDNHVPGLDPKFQPGGTVTDTAAAPPRYAPGRRAGNRGARESHEPRLDVRLFLEPAPEPDTFSEWDGTNGVTNWGMDGNGPDTPGPGPEDPPAYPQGMGNCGYAAPDHGNAAKANNIALVGTLGRPAFPVPFGAYWAYGVSQGEQGQAPVPANEPDQGVDNRSWLAFLYKAGVIKGYAEVPVDQIGHYAPLGHGLLIGQNLPDSAESDFEASPPIPWGSPGEVPDSQEGHDTWVILTHANASGELITWGGLQPFSSTYLKEFVTDAWMVWTADDPEDISPELQAALTALHGVQEAA